MKVIATARGFDNVATREVGEEFDMPKGSKGSWFAPVAKQAEAKAEAEAKAKAEDGTPAGDLA